MDFELTTVPVLDTIVHNTNQLNVPVFSTTVTDNGEWFTFVTNYNGHTVSRIQHGNSPFNQSNQIVEIIGSFGTTNKLEGIEVLKNTNGNWFGFVVNDRTLYRWEFANNDLSDDIINVETIDLPDYLHWPHQLSILWIEDLQKFIGFTVNRNSTYGMARMDFGNDLSNIPVLTTIDAPTGAEGHSNFSLIQENGEWYMFLTNLHTHNLSRYDFGADIENDQPVQTVLGNIDNAFNLPRGILVFPNCSEKELFAYVVNENGSFFKLSFNNGITAIPDLDSLGSLGIKRNSMTTLLFEGALHLILTNQTYSMIEAAPLFALPDPHSIAYYNATVSHTFNQEGMYEVALYTNPGGLIGTSSSCKIIEVLEKREDVNISEFEKNALGIKVYPNPVKDILVLDFESLDINIVSPIYVKIYDILGRLMEEVTVHSTDKRTFIMDTKSWSSGTYFLELMNEGQRLYSQQVMKY